jgi:hypothetical protein
MSTDDHGRPGDAEWLTLTEAAARSGHSREALRQRVRRGSLASQRRNTDGQIVVRASDVSDLPPPDAAPDELGRPADAVETATLDVLREALDDLRSTVNVLMQDLERTRSALADAQAGRLVDRGRAERAEAQAAAEILRADKAESRLSAAEEALKAAHADLLADRGRAERAEAEARIARAELEEARRPWLVRVYRGLKGSGGGVGG